MIINADTKAWFFSPTSVSKSNSLSKVSNSICQVKITSVTQK